MWSFLSKVDPNTIVGVLTALATFAAWGYHKIRGNEQASFMDTFTGLGKQVIHVLLTDPAIGNDANVEAVKARVTLELWALATKIGVPRNAITEAIAGQVIEHTVGDVLREFRNREDVAKKAQTLIDNLPTLEDVRKWFTPPVPPADTGSGS